MEESKKNYLSGIIGSLIGGLVASIPWILMYVYGNMILSLLAIIIALGALKGYQLFKGKVDGKLPIIIVIVSIFCVSLSTLIIIPLLLLNKEGFNVSLDNLQFLYENNEFFSALMKDYMISLLFTFLGIGGVISNIKKQIYEGKTENLKVLTNQPQDSENMKIIKDAFTKLNAFDKYSAVSKEDIFNELTSPDAKMLFDRLKMQQIIIKYKGKYYFSIQNEKSFFRRFIRLYLKIMAILVILICIFIAILFIFNM